MYQLITGHNDKLHLEALKKVLDRLHEYGLHLKKEKCLFMQLWNTSDTLLIKRAFALLQRRWKPLLGVQSQGMYMNSDPSLVLWTIIESSSDISLHWFSRWTTRDVPWKWSKDCQKAFDTHTDHKPLLTILGPKKGLPTLAAARLQRWTIILTVYQYDLEFRSTQAHSSADGFFKATIAGTSQCCMWKQSDGCTSSNSWVCVNLGQIEIFPVDTDRLRHATQADPVLSKVCLYTQRGWPNDVNPEQKPYATRRYELTVEAGCLLWEMRVVIPDSCRKDVLRELHTSHPGIVKMKSLARVHVWWPRIDKCICQLLWQKTLDVLGGMFARDGLPEQLVSDNEPQFISSEFERLMKENGIKYIRTSPYHPASNGEAERFVQRFKHSLKATKNDSGSLTTKLSRFLITYRTPSSTSTTGVSPAELFMKRPLRTRLDLLRPSIQILDPKLGVYTIQVQYAPLWYQVSTLHHL